MASVYPGALDTLATNKANTTVTDTDHPAHHNDMADAINKIEAELGADPSGTFSTVKLRLDARLTCRKTADQAFATTTLANVTDMSFPVNANLDYMFRFVMMYAPSTTTTGIAFSFTGPASPTAFSAGASFYALTGSAVATNVQGGISAYSAKMQNASATTAGANYIVEITGILSNGATAGTLQLQASEGGGTAASVTVKRGSYGEIYIN